MTEAESTVPLACVPSAIPAAERATHFARLRHLFAEEAQERMDIPGGYSWRFPPDALAEVVAFVSMERRCCPFLRFRIEVTSDHGPVWLAMEGPDGTRNFLEAELGIAGTTRRS